MRPPSRPPPPRLGPLGLALALLFALPAPARAWSEPGHRIVGAIAEARLGPAAKRLVAEVIGAGSISDREVAAWADHHKDQRTKAWHYVNVPFPAPAFDRTRDCPRATGCVVSAIEDAAAGLRDARDAVELADSLRFLVHLVADIHQPMHAGDGRDRGGNETEVRIGKRTQPVSVHRLWDAELVDPLVPRGDVRAAARALLAGATPAELQGWAADPSPASWATASHLAARDFYRELEGLPREGKYTRLSAGFADAHREQVGHALLAAGVRLAALLDRIAAERDAKGARR
jgi:hypothetical protein